MAATDTPHRTAAQVCRIIGAAATGKTEELMCRISGLLSSGVAPEAIGVFAATPDACAALHTRLVDAADGAPVPLVRTALDFQLELLGLPEARHAVGCEPHVMLRFEENIFLEDMKVCGVQPKRLAGMIRFLERSACDLEKMESAWFYNTEEENAFHQLENLQRYYQAYTRQMVPSFAYRFAVDFPVAAGKLAFSHVFIDDYQLLSRASQCLLGLMARETLTVAGDPLARVAVFEEFPYPDGLEELAADNAGCVRVDLSASHAAPAVARAMDVLMADEALAGEGAVAVAPAGTEDTSETGAADGAFALLAFDDPGAELDGVAAKVAGLVAEGIPADQIAVACPKPVWERNTAKALRAVGVPVAGMHRPNVSGDVRSLDASFEARIVTLLKLAANPADRLALRCWCGFGDYLANSALFTGMAKAGVHVALDTAMISTTGEEDALFLQQRDRILASLEEARTLLPQLEGLAGLPLIAAAAKLVSRSQELKPGFLRAFGKVTPDMDASALVAALEQNVQFPRFAGEGVRVALTCDFCGLRPQVMVMDGMVNGMTPAQEYFDPTQVERDKRPAQLAHEAAKVYVAAGKADRRLLVSYFTSAPLVESEHLRLKVERVRFIDGMRRAEIRPSETVRAWTGVRFND